MTPTSVLSILFSYGTLSSCSMHPSCPFRSTCPVGWTRCELSTLVSLTLKPNSVGFRHTSKILVDISCRIDDASAAIAKDTRRRAKLVDFIVGCCSVRRCLMENTNLALSFIHSNVSRCLHRDCLIAS